MEFGEKIAGQEYVLRPGAYAIIFDPDRRVAIIKTPRGYYLPGGGSEPGETPEQTLIREVNEECGFTIQIGEILGEAVEYVYAAEEAIYFAKQGVFFTAVVVGEGQAPTEADHMLSWLETEQAIAVLTHQSHVWAVRQAIIPTSDKTV